MSKARRWMPILVCAIACLGCAGEKKMEPRRTASRPPDENPIGGSYGSSGGGLAGAGVGGITGGVGGITGFGGSYGEGAVRPPDGAYGQTAELPDFEVGETPEPPAGEVGEAVEPPSYEVGESAVPREVAPPPPMIDYGPTVDVSPPLPLPTPSGRSSFATVRVFYATDRGPTGSDEPGKFYGRERGDISLGVCDVSIPPSHKTGELEAPKIWKFEFHESPQKHVVLLNVQPVDGRTFLSELQRTINESIETVQSGGVQRHVGGEAFVFIHGYNVTFEDAARRTAQIAYDLDFRGAPVMYSWPSQGEPGLDAYKNDSRTADWCEENVMEFIVALAQHSGARKLHLIAHSMGNRIVAGALRRLTQDFPRDEIPKFNEVILTAPDIDARTFKETIAPRIIHAAGRITIYASADDVALKASSLVNTLGDPRLGQAGSVLTMFPEYREINVIDASDVDTSLFDIKHSYHAKSKTVLSDIRLVFEGKPPAERGLEAIANNLAWRFSEGNSRLGDWLRGLRR